MVLHWILLYLCIGLIIAIYTAKSVEPDNENLTPGPVAMITLAWPVFLGVVVVVAIRMKLRKKNYVEHRD